MWWQRKRSPTDFSSELQAHLALEADRLRAEGLNEEEARSRAIKNLGNVTKSEERFYESSRLIWLDQLRQDIGYGLRQLIQNKSFTVVACAALALGIGANTAIFTLIHAVMFKTLPVNRPAELYRLGKGDNCCVMTGYQDGQDFALFSYDLYKTLRIGMPEITQMAAFQAAPQTVSIRRSGSTEPSQPSTVEYVSSNYFDLFGLHPTLGNFFAARNDLPGVGPAMVLSYRAWQTYYQGDPRIVGSTFLIKGEAFTVIGIAPPKFYGETLRSDPPDFWLPLATEPLLEGTNNLFSRPDKMWLYVMGRIPSGPHSPETAVRAAEAKLNVEAKRWYLAAAGSHPSAEIRRTINEQYIPLTSASGGVGLMSIAYRDGLFLLMSLSLLVLLIACANVANLLLARGTTLRAQISLKLALGASRGRITRQAVTDSVILSLLGGSAGIAVAFVTTRLILLLAFRGARYVPISATPSLPVLIFAFFVSVTTGLLFGIAPAWMQTHSDPADALRSAGRSTPAATSLLQRFLVIAQAALSLVLLTGAGLLTQSLRNLETQQFGFVTDHRVLVSLNPALTGYTAEQLASTYRNLQHQLGQMPGVIHASLSMYAPMTGQNWNERIYLERNGAAQNGNTPVLGVASYDRVSPGYFETLGTHLVEGRAFNEYDGPSSPRVAIVNRTFVAENFPHQNPIGRRFGGQAPTRAADYRIVGVVEDTKYDNTDKPAHPTFFLPLLQMEKNPDGSLSSDNYVGDIELYVTGNLDRLEPRVRSTVEQVDSHLAVLTVRNYSDQLGLQFNQQRLIATLTQLFGALALVLASVGLYGLISLTVARRTAEIGIRMALGATRSSVVATILRGAIVQVWLGIAVGVPLTLAGAGLIRHQLFQVSSYNPATFVAAGLLLIACAGMAALIPGRRAASIDPMLALRLD